mmetsp:Transcript_2757/g.8362  ORF Transcript_2757/g.8362 Transcript_2757/m.8362 type:complete len:254 (-) Transcript_2757:7-768(-)
MKRTTLDPFTAPGGGYDGGGATSSSPEEAPATSWVLRAARARATRRWGAARVLATLRAGARSVVAVRTSGALRAMARSARSWCWDFNLASGSKSSGYSGMLSSAPPISRIVGVSPSESSSRRASTDASSPSRGASSACGGSGYATMVWPMKRPRRKARSVSSRALAQSPFGMTLRAMDRFLNSRRAFVIESTSLRVSAATATNGVDANNSFAASINACRSARGRICLALCVPSWTAPSWTAACSGEGGEAARD